MVQLAVLSTLVIFSVTNFAFYSHCELDDAVTITGYFTPVETDYDAKEMVSVSTDAGSRQYRVGFWEDLLIEWVGISQYDKVVAIWGKDRRGKPEVYINLDTPMDALGGELRPYNTATLFTPGTAASNHLEPGTVVRVIKNSHVPLWTQPLYQVTDTIGGPHDPKHIDLYMGEGLQAKARTTTVTKLNGTGTICVYRQVG